MAFRNRVTERLGIEHPVLLAPMDVVSGGRLAAAMSQAGGLGLLGGGYGDGEWLEREWGRAGNARIGCGFITWSLAKRPQLLDSVLRHQPAAIMLSFGDPGPFAPAIRAAGARLICQVQTVAQALEASESRCGRDYRTGHRSGRAWPIRTAPHTAAEGGGCVFRHSCSRCRWNCRWARPRRSDDAGR